ncbi:hypothetical protein E4T44_00985 [Aureobasidium sp. EXF-8845]|nr:hypothetical protein E4T44_00985 [Aureobasidium sp. EXF-8845]KAI4857553.1 hypothetical protein E4T45_00952 [Aureobasidium sp. EXF-8846]
MWLLPVETAHNQDGTIEDLTWKIWIISTRLDYLDGLAENKDLLFAPHQRDDHASTLEIDVFILGGGNAAAALAARLKALGVSNIMADRNANVGDNWALRYDSLKFHAPTSYCGLPYMDYPPELQDKVLRRDDLAAHLRNYVKTFGLDVINSVEIISTTQEQDGRWTVRLRTPQGEHKVLAKHLVQATGIGSQIPYTPAILERDAYKGIAMHSSQYKNTASLTAQGVKSVCVVGSASTAFDVIEDCYNAGLQVTMIVRSPQYLVPFEYICHELGLGSYDLDVEASDNMIMMMPMIVDSQLGQGLFAQLASQESDRYSALREAGFPVIDSRDPDAALMHNLIERGGGHYVDTGATKLLAEGKLDTDAVIWCTGFADKDARETVADIMKIALPVDATWGVDEEGEIRGMWKRHSKVHNYWFMGGFTQQHRWYSRTLAQQIKAALEGVLPPPYLDLQN